MTLSNSDERYDSAENNGESYRWANRNPPIHRQSYQPPIIRQNPPRYPQHKNQTIDNRYK